MISDFFGHMPLTEEQMEKIYDYLESNGIFVDRSNDEPDRRMLDEAEEEIDPNDISVPEGIGTNDPVRMYLKEIKIFQILTIGRVEVELIKRWCKASAGAAAKMAEFRPSPLVAHCEAVRRARYVSDLIQEYTGPDQRIEKATL